eukprot:755071-Hanusia_phi.AAC.1
MSQRPDESSMHDRRRRRRNERGGALLLDDLEACTCSRLLTVVFKVLSKFRDASSDVKTLFM